MDFHLPRLLAVLSAARVTIVEPDDLRRSELARRFGRDRRIDLAEQLDADGTFDLAVIATPPRFHADYFHALSRRARAVVIEKPLAIDAAKAEGIRDAICAGGPEVFVCLVRRGLAAFGLLREFWRSGHFGALESVEFHEGRVYAWEATSLGSFSKDLNGGGVLMDTGPHALDQLLRFFDEAELEHACMDGDPGGIEANATLALRADGVPVTMQLSRNRNLSNTATFEFEAARCRVGLGDDHFRVEPSKGAAFDVHGREGAGPSPDFADLFDRFYVERVLSADASGVGVDSSLTALRLIEAAYGACVPMQGGF